MQIYPESKRLKAVQIALKSARFSFGPNKKQELIRLIYEISKKDNLEPKELLSEAIRDYDFKDSKQAFIHLKNYFLQRRFPNSYHDRKNIKFYLPKLSIDDKFIAVKKDSFKFNPEKIFIEKEAKNYALTNSILNKFPHAKKINISSLKDYIKADSQGKHRIWDYNSRVKSLFLIKEKSDFLKPCPCTKGALNCGYYVINLGFGCIYECSYCFLQDYTNASGMILPVNIEDFLKKLEVFIKNNSKQLRFGTGEFTDSLALDDLTNYSKDLIEFFSRFDNALLELKTKSANIKNILNLSHNKKTVISWSLNPQEIVNSDEWCSVSLKERLESAKQCVQAGYLVGFHFDPVIYSGNWEEIYKGLISELFRNIDEKNIAWISLGTFRFSPRLKTIIEQRFVQSKILNEELIIGFDKKLRYPDKLRLEIYKKMLSWIRAYSSSVLVYLCMESRQICDEILG